MGGAKLARGGERWRKWMGNGVIEGEREELKTAKASSQK